MNTKLFLGVGYLQGLLDLPLYFFQCVNELRYQQARELEMVRIGVMSTNGDEIPIYAEYEFYGRSSTRFQKAYFSLVADCSGSGS